MSDSPQLMAWEMETARRVLVQTERNFSEATKANGYSDGDWKSAVFDGHSVRREDLLSAIDQLIAALAVPIFPEVVAPAETRLLFQDSKVSAEYPNKADGTPFGASHEVHPSSPESSTSAAETRQPAAPRDFQIGSTPPLTLANIELQKRSQPLAAETPPRPDIDFAGLPMEHQGFAGTPIHLLPSNLPAIKARWAETREGTLEQHSIAVVKLIDRDVPQLIAEVERLRAVGPRPDCKDCRIVIIECDTHRREHSE